MKMVDSRTGLESISRDECLQLLAGDEIGRLAVIDGRTPVILPVNYAMDGDAIVFRTAAGTKLEAGPRSPASFQIDSIDREHHTGWSVVVTGRLEEVTEYDSETLDRLRRLDVAPWAGGDKPHWMRLEPARITGRRIGTGR
jgi:uncharacterized protein